MYTRIVYWKRGDGFTGILLLHAVAAVEAGKDVVRKVHHHRAACVAACSRCAVFGDDTLALLLGGGHGWHPVPRKLSTEYGAKRCIFRVLASSKRMPLRVHLPQRGAIDRHQRKLDQQCLLPPRPWDCFNAPGPCPSRHIQLILVQANRSGGRAARDAEQQGCPCSHTYCI